MVMLFLLPSPDDPFFWLLLDDEHLLERSYSLRLRWQQALC